MNYTAAEIYELLCVPDIELNELVALVNLIEAVQKHIPTDHAQWLINKATHVKLQIMARDPNIEALKKRAKGKQLPPDDENYTDYEQSENK